MKVKVVYSTGSTEWCTTECTTLDKFAMEKWGRDSAEQLRECGVTLKEVEFLPYEEGYVEEVQEELEEQLGTVDSGDATSTAGAVPVATSTATDNAEATDKASVEVVASKNRRRSSAT